MPTRNDATVIADADSLAVALKPHGYLTARSVVAVFMATGYESPTAGGWPGSLRTISPEAGWGAAA